jgi:hypothetical protein
MVGLKNTGRLCRPSCFSFYSIQSMGTGQQHMSFIIDYYFNSSFSASIHILLAMTGVRHCSRNLRHDDEPRNKEWRTLGDASLPGIPPRHCIHEKHIEKDQMGLWVHGKYQTSSRCTCVLALWRHTWRWSSAKSSPARRALWAAAAAPTEQTAITTQNNGTTRY